MKTIIGNSHYLFIRFYLTKHTPPNPGFRVSDVLLEKVMIIGLPLGAAAVFVVAVENAAVVFTSKNPLSIRSAGYLST